MKARIAFIALLLFAVAPLRADDPPQGKKYTVYGSILTVYNDTKHDGLLISCEDRGRIGTSEAKDVIFLIGHPKQKDAVDGNQVDCVAVETGRYSYTAVSGASKTVKALTFVSGH